jgi:dynein light chain roadblock-type
MCRLEVGCRRYKLGHLNEIASTAEISKSGICKSSPHLTWGFRLTVDTSMSWHHLNDLGNMSEIANLPNGRESLSPAPLSATIPPEIEGTLARLSAYRSVRGVMILSRTPVDQTQTGSTTNTNGGGGIVQCTGNIFEGEGGQKYARLVEGLVSSAARGVGECDAGVSRPQGISSHCNAV